MSLFTEDYNSGGSSGNNSGSDSDNDFEERNSLKLSNYAQVSFEVDRIGEFTGSNFGQSLIIDVDDVEVHHGMVYDRFKGDDDDTMKVFGYGKWFQTDENGLLDEELSDELINRRISEEFGGEQYPYEFVDRVEESEDSNIEMGNMTLWANNGTKFRTIAKVLTPAGHDVIDDKEDDHNWANEDQLEVRDDLEGRRIILFFKKDSFIPQEHQGDDDEEEHRVSYTDAALFDAETRAPITIQNGSDESDSSDSSEDSEASSGDSGSLGGDDDGLPEGVPDDLSDIIGFMANTDETNPENVEQFCDGETDEDYDLDAVIQAIENHDNY